MHTLLLLALLTWPFGHTHRLNERHPLRYHARHLAHVQQARAHRLTRRRHAAHASLIHF